MKGVLQSWHENGFGMVSADRELFFLHRNNIADGEPIVGSLVEFDVAPPRGNGKFQQAVAAVILTPTSFDNRVLRGEGGAL